MTARRITAMLLVAAATALAPLADASADAIDGDWCFTDGRRLSIDGPTVVTPGGARLEGDYDRHAFSYVAPGGENGAGSAVFLELIDDDTVHLRFASTQGPAQTWKRCAAAVS